MSPIAQTLGLAVRPVAGSAAATPARTGTPSAPITPATPAGPSCPSGPHDRVQGDLEPGVLDRPRAAPARRVRLAQRHRVEGDAPHMATAAVDLHRRREPADGDAERSREVDRVRVGGAFDRAAAVEERDLPGAEADGCGRGIERRAAAADDADPAAGEGSPGVAVDRLPDDIERVDHARQVLAGDAQALAVAQAHGDHDRVVAREQRLGLHVPPDHRAQHEPRPGPLHLRDLARDRLARQAPGHDAVVAQAAGAVMGVVDGDPDAGLAQLRGTREAGGPGADDRGAGVRLLARREERATCRGVRLHGVPLQATDGDRAVQGRPDAGALAQALDRAGRATRAAQRVGREDRPRAALQVAGCDLADERGDVDPGRTGARARGFVAVEAALRLRPRGTRRQQRHREERVGLASAGRVEAHGSWTLGRSPSGLGGEVEKDPWCAPGAVGRTAVPP